MAILLSEEIHKTCVRLNTRITDRFPASGLAQTSNKLLDISDHIESTIIWIKKPNYFIRISSWVVIALLSLVVIRTFLSLHITFSGMNMADFCQMIDAGFNSIIILGATGIYLMTLEVKRKRKRIINSINKLRSISHIIDAHQLTKDPHSMAEKQTSNSPDRELSDYDLGRYLDYCSEMLSLTGKIAFLYVQNFEDQDSNAAVNTLEALCSSLSQKIWQKISILTGSNNAKI